MAKCIKNCMFIFLFISFPLQIGAQIDSRNQIKLLFDIVKNTREAVAQTKFDKTAPDANRRLSEHLSTIESIAVVLNK
ncbi:MAG: hypothetical protein KAR38_13045, partial [Calditrichia bacterium]|nr:hypothetical protein [Calditrichia bacterium]